MNTNSLKIFLFSFFISFLFVSFKNTDSSFPEIEKETKKQIDVFSEVKTQLAMVQNSFHLKKSSNFISSAYAGGEYDSANAYAVIDLNTGEVIKEKNISKRLSIASLTKIMTAIVALDLASLDDVFTVSHFAASQIPTKIGLSFGEKLTLDELLHAVLLTSANDAAEVIKEGIDAKYKEQVFIKAMNEKAKLIGLKNTHFVNPQGFDNKLHYSSAEDLAILTGYALKHYPYIIEIVSKDYFFLPKNKDHKQYDLYNWNGLIGVYANAYGVKIGNTSRAKKTTIVAAEREGKNIMVILLGAPSILKRDLWAAQLLDEGFKLAYNLPHINVTEEMLRQKYQKWQ